MTMTKIVKRDGREVPFDRMKIKEAIARCFLAGGEGAVDGVSIDARAGYLADDVVDNVVAFSQKRGVPITVEGVQDEVERTLMHCGFADTAKRYILYRAKVRPGGRTFNNEAAMFTGSMKVSANPQWGEGPWGDWHPAETPDIEPYAQFYDNDIPDAGCGYIEVPAGSGS